MKYKRSKEKSNVKDWEDEYESVYDFLYCRQDQQDQYDLDPTMFEVRWGMLLMLLAKLRVGSAKNTLKGWYW